MTKASPLKGRKQKPETIAKRKATYAARRKEREQQNVELIRKPRAGAYVPTAADISATLHLLIKAANVAREEFRPGKRGGISDTELYVHMAKRTLEGGLQ